MQITGGNDISLIYPWLHISDCLADLAVWAGREVEPGPDQPGQSRRLVQVDKV